MKLSFINFLCFIIVAVPTVHANSLTLREALARTLSKNPRLAAESWELRIAEAKQLQAGLRPNPELAFDVQNFLGSNKARGFQESETTLTISQLVELGGKRAARVREAGAERNVKLLTHEAKRLEALEVTARSFADVLGAQRKVERSKELSALANELLPLIETRLQAGKASAAEQARGAAAAASSLALIEKANGELAAARRHLAAQWGRSEPDFDVAVGELSDTHKLPSLSVLRDRLADHPLITKWNAEHTKREATVSKEKAAAKSDVRVFAGPRWLNDGGGSAAVTAGVSIPLPFRNKNQGNIKAAEAQLSQTTDEKRAEQNELNARLGEAWEKMQSAQRQLATLNDKVLPTAKSAIEATRAGYETGKLSQLDVLDSRRVLAEAEALLLDALIEARKASIEIEVLTGMGCGAATH